MSVTGGNYGNGANRPVSGVVTASAEQAKLTEATQLLVHRGFPASMFTVQNVQDQGYEVDQFLNLIKPLSSIKDNFELARTLVLALPTFWYAPDFATFPNLINFVTWLETDAARAKLDALSKQRSLELRSGGDFLSTTKAVAFVQIQLSDYTESQKRVRETYEAEISEWRKRIRVKEDEMRVNLEGMRSHFWPVAYYEPPTQAQVEVAAYDLYVSDAQKKNLSYLDRDDEGYAKAVELFGSIARDQHMANWVNEGDRKKVLIDYCKGRYLYLQGAGEQQEADELGYLMAAVGQEEALDASAGGAAGGVIPDDLHSLA